MAWLRITVDSSTHDPEQLSELLSGAGDFTLSFWLKTAKISPQTILVPVI